jgi:hypothetical protein
MNEDRFEANKAGILEFVQAMFEEMEEDMAMSHQEKYALLEDSFENATDMDEIRVAFEQWYNDHAEEMGLDMELEELWGQAMANAEE